MNSLKIVALLLVLASAGCKQSADTIVALQEISANTARYEFTGAGIPYKAGNGQVFEYH
jgi:hypothetical protein